MGKGGATGPDDGRLARLERAGVIRRAPRERLDEIIKVTFADDVLSWELDDDGGWSKVPTEQGVDVQEAMMARAIARAREPR